MAGTGLGRCLSPDVVVKEGVKIKVIVIYLIGMLCMIPYYFYLLLNGLWKSIVLYPDGNPVSVILKYFFIAIIPPIILFIFMLVFGKKWKLDQKYNIGTFIVIALGMLAMLFFY